MEPEQNQSPIIPIEQINPLHSHKILWILLSVFVLLTFAGLFVFKYQVSQKSEVSLVQNIATTTDEFAGWETYRNEEYGFEFKYPRDWDISTAGEYDVFRVVINSPVNYISLKSWREKDIPGDMGPVDDIMVSIHSKDMVYNKKSFEEYINTEKNTGIFTDMKLIRFGGINNAYEGVENGFSSYYTILSEHNDNLFQISFGYKWKKEEITYIENKILSTFKFIATSTSTDISTWKTYDNKKLGFSFKYPSSYVFNLNSSVNKDTVYFFRNSEEMNNSTEWGDIFHIGIGKMESNSLSGYLKSYGMTVDGEVDFNGNHYISAYEDLGDEMIVYSCYYSQMSSTEFIGVCTHPGFKNSSEFSSILESLTFTK